MIRYKYIQTKRTATFPGFFALLGMFLIVFIGPVQDVRAQKNNLSDWRVPPPLPPGNLGKGNAAGNRKTATPVAVLALTNIPAVLLSIDPPVNMSMLAAVSTTSPMVNAPEQPNVFSSAAGVVEIPLPSAPSNPPMPSQSLHDAVIPSTFELPVPTEPELPPFPAEPKSSGQIQSTRTFIPAMPDLVALPAPSLPVTALLNSWPVPGIPETIPVKLSPAVETKGMKLRSKGNTPR